MFENKYMAISKRMNTLITPSRRVSQGVFLPASETNMAYKLKAKTFSDLVSCGAKRPKACYATQPV